MSSSLVRWRSVQWSGRAFRRSRRCFHDPGPGSGVSKVTGNVTIDELPDVNARQRGSWRVGITDLPEIQVAGPAFVRPGGRYEVTWQGGDKESLVVSSIGADGWVKVEHQRSRWVNLGLARSVEGSN